MHRSIITLILCLSLSACQTVNKQDIGTVTGGVLGGLLGSQFGGGAGKVAATVGGSVIGALIGGSIGHTMDKVDQMKVQHALETAQTGQVVRWKNPDSGHRYSVEPTRTYYANEQPCRTFVTRAIIDGHSQQIHGRACRNNNGTWHIK